MEFLQRLWLLVKTLLKRMMPLRTICVCWATVLGAARLP